VGELYPAWQTDVELMAWVHEAMDTDSLLSARKIRQAIETKDDIDNAFDDLTYSKGAGIISMFERYLGAQPFRAGVRRYLDKHRFGAATTEQFMAAVMAGQPPELSVAFQQLLDRPGVPRVALTTRCEGAKLAAVDVSVERYLPLGSKAESKLDFTLPLCVSLDGKPVCDVVEVKAGAPGKLELGGERACPKSTFPNADGAGYLRYTPNAAQAKALFGPSFSQLTLRERRSAVDSLAAGFRAGTLDSRAVLDSLGAIAKDPSRHVAFAAGGLLGYFEIDLVAPKDRAALSKLVGGHFSARYKALGWEAKAGEDADTKLARRDVIDAMLFLARDPQARSEAITRARKVAGVDGPPDRDAAPPELFRAVLTVGVQDGGGPVFDALVQRFVESDEAVYRRGVLAALARAKRDDLATKARAFALDDRVRASERIRYVFELFAVPEQRGPALSWLAAELPALLTALPEGTRGYLPMVAESLCDAGLEPQLRALFAPHMKQMTGGPRTLENALEKMRICDATKLHQAPGLAVALAGR
jgi:alanyl aminopeptidase